MHSKPPLATDIKLGTDILKVKVPDQLRQRRSLGITWLNTSLGGRGMTPSTVMMLTGSPGYGKSTLMRQLADSITQQGHLAIYNTGEESVYQVKMRIEEMGLKNGFEVGTEVYVGELLKYARAQQQVNPKRQVFVLQDSLQTLNDGYYKDGGVTSQTAVRCCEMLIDWAKETYGIVVFIGQVTKSGIFAGKNVIRHLIDVHGELVLDDDANSVTRGSRLFTLSKNRFGPEGISFPYGLNDKGIFVNEEIAARKDESGPSIRTTSGTRQRVNPIPREETGT